MHTVLLRRVSIGFGVQGYLLYVRRPMKAKDYDGLCFEIVPIAISVAIALGLDYDIFLVSPAGKESRQGSIGMKSTLNPKIQSHKNP